jgi:hypothetical protein
VCMYVSQCARAAKSYNVLARFANDLIDFRWRSSFNSRLSLVTRAIHIFALRTGEDGSVHITALAASSTRALCLFQVCDFILAQIDILCSYAMNKMQIKKACID